MMRSVHAVFAAAFLAIAGARTTWAQSRLKVEQRYHGDTLWLTSRGDLGVGVQRQIIHRGFSYAPDSLWVDFTRNDSLESSRLYVLKRDSIWLVNHDGRRQLLSGAARVIPSGMRDSWEAHWRLERGDLPRVP